MTIQDYRADALRCTRCAYCKWVPLDLMKSWRFSKGCPSVEYGKFHSYSAGGRLITSLSLMDGRSTVTDKVKDSVFMCNMCGSCDVACKMCRYDMEPLLAMHELRAKLVEDGDLPEAYQPMLELLRKDYNTMGEPHERARRLGEGSRRQGSHQDHGEIRLPCRLPLFVRRRAERSRPHCGRDPEEGGPRFRHHGRRRELLRRQGVQHRRRPAAAQERRSQSRGVEEGGRRYRHHAVRRLLLRVQAPLHRSTPVRRSRSSTWSNCSTRWSRTAA